MTLKKTGDVDMSLKTEYKYISFKLTDVEDYKKGAECLNKKSGLCLGYVEYYKPWKQYVIEFLEDCVFNNSCLLDIADFLGQLNKNEGIKPEKIVNNKSSIVNRQS